MYAFISSTHGAGFIIFLNKNRTGAGMMDKSARVTAARCSTTVRPSASASASATSRSNPRFSFAFALASSPTTAASFALNNEIANASSAPSAYVVLRGSMTPSLFVVALGEYVALEPLPMPNRTTSTSVEPVLSDDARGRAGRAGRDEGDANRVARV
jgi:hypothetical protein